MIFNLSRCFKQVKHIALLAGLPFVLTSCSNSSFPGSQLFVSKSSQPIPLEALKTITASIKVNKAWQVSTGSSMGENLIHPYVDNAAVYVAGGTSASSWNKSNGKMLWKLNVGETVSAGLNGSDSNNRTKQLFIGTTNGNAIAIDAKSGKIQWIERLSSEVLSVSPSKDNRVVFRTIDGKIHGLSSLNGELIWQRSQDIPSLTSVGASVPVIVPPLVISGFDNGKVAAYNLQDGRSAWEVTLAIPRGQTDLDRIVDVDGKIKPLGNALFAASLNGSSSGINMETGKLAWSKSFSTSAGVNVNTTGVYSADDIGNLWKFNPQTGEPVWSIDDLQRRQPTVPVFVSGSHIVVGDKQGNLHWVNTSTGKFVARIKGDLSGYSVEPAVIGNSIYAFGKGGVLSKLQLQ
ncbi:MAG: outer membrane protein assembly factor BamB [Cocleimonas sp.]